MSSYDRVQLGILHKNRRLGKSCWRHLCDSVEESVAAGSSARWAGPEARGYSESGVWKERGEE